MSKQTMKISQSINQKDNRLKLQKYSEAYKKVLKNDTTTEQDKLQAITQNTLVERIDRSKSETKLVKTAKAINKINTNKLLINECLSIIAKSNPRFNVVLKIA